MLAKAFPPHKGAEAARDERGAVRKPSAKAARTSTDVSINLLIDRIGLIAITPPIVADGVSNNRTHPLDFGLRIAEDNVIRRAFFVPWLVSRPRLPG